MKRLIAATIIFLFGSSCVFTETGPEVNESVSLDISTYSAKISVTDMDIEIARINNELSSLSMLMSDTRTAVEKLAETSISYDGKIKIMERKIADMEGYLARVENMGSELYELRIRISKNDEINKKYFSDTLKRQESDIKSVDDTCKIILDDLYRLKEDIAAGRKPEISRRKTFKEYLPYISAGISVISLIISLH